MAKVIRRTAALAMGFLFSISALAGGTDEIIRIPVPEARTTAPTAQQTVADERKALPADTVAGTLAEERESIFRSRPLSLAFSHFTWGAEAGASLDLTSHDLSTFDVDVLLGYKNSFIKLAGVGAGIHRSVHKGNNFIPVYAVFRSSFRSRPSLLFLNVQAGYSFNSFGDGKSVGDFMGALGVGINLQQTRTAKSYFVLSAAYQYFNAENQEKIGIYSNYIFFARLMFGVNF